MHQAAIEKPRVEQIAVTDTSSKRITQALADAALVLTPNQRKKLAERAQTFGERRGWMRGQAASQERVQAIPPRLAWQHLRVFSEAHDQFAKRACYTMPP